MRIVSSAHSREKKCIKPAQVAINPSLPEFWMFYMATVMAASNLFRGFWHLDCKQSFTQILKVHENK